MKLQRIAAQAAEQQKAGATDNQLVAKRMVTL
jgi:hypothetical protein